MKTAVSIPDDLFKTAEAVARRLGLSRSALYQRALATFLESRDDRMVTSALNEVYSADGDVNRIDPMLKRLQAASLPAEEW